MEWPCRIYQNVDGSWPSDQRTDTDWVQEGHPTDNRLVRIANMSELDWVQRWKLAIQMAAESKQQGTLTEADRCVAQAIEERSRQSSTVVNHDVSLRSAPGILSGIQELITQHQTLRGWGGDC